MLSCDVGSRRCTFRLIERNRRATLEPTFDGLQEQYSEDALKLVAIGIHMHTRKVQVKNGRLVLDEPTDLPDGAEVEVLVIDDQLTAEERAELHASLDRALEDSDAGRGVEAWEYLERYRAGREDRSTR